VVMFTRAYSLRMSMSERYEHEWRVSVRQWPEMGMILIHVCPSTSLSITVRWSAMAGWSAMARRMRSPVVLIIHQSYSIFQDEHD
jgi:hypothetical protein